MFSLFKKQSTTPLDCKAFVTDMHAHWLPGIDDGAQDLAESIELIKALKAAGYQKLIATPHIYWDLYQNTPAIIQQALASVQEAVLREGIDIALHAAAEYMLDEHFTTLLASDEPLLCIHKNWVLVECSYVSAPLDFKEKLFQLQMKGYQPVLAHPERYPYWYHRLDYFEELSSQGILLQANLLSILGYYGKEVQKVVHHLLDRQLIDLVGTDVHHERHIEAFNNIKLPQSLQKLLASNSIQNINI